MKLGTRLHNRLLFNIINLSFNFLWCFSNGILIIGKARNCLKEIIYIGDNECLLFDRDLLILQFESIIVNEVCREISH